MTVTIKFTGGPNRPDQPHPSVMAALQKVGDASLPDGSTLTVYSGTGEYGSTRHRASSGYLDQSKYGVAADVRVALPSGRRATAKEMKAFGQAWAAATKGGVGYGKGYMGVDAIHLDLVTQSMLRPGQAMQWGGEAQKWNLAAYRAGQKSAPNVSSTMLADANIPTPANKPGAFPIAAIPLPQAAPRGENPWASLFSHSSAQAAEMPIADRAAGSTALTSIVPSNADAPSLDAYQSGYGNSAPAMAAPLGQVEKGDPLAPAAYNGNPVLSDAGQFDAGMYVGNDPVLRAMPTTGGEFAAATDPLSQFEFTPGLSPVEPVTPAAASTEPKDWTEYGAGAGPSGGTVVSESPFQPPQGEPTPPSVSMAGVTSDDLAGDPLRSALAQMAQASTAESNTPVPEPRPSIEPIPQERPSIEPVPTPRPTMVGATEIAGTVPTPGDRPQTNTAGIPVSTDPWDAMRMPSSDPLSSLVSSYMPVDPATTSATQPSGFAANLAYAQANPSEIDIDPALMDPALGAPVDPLKTALQPPVKPLAPPVAVGAYPVYEAAPAKPVAQTMDVPSGTDVWQGKSSYGMDTAGGTMWRDPLSGDVQRYSPVSDSVHEKQADGSWLPVGGDPLMGALGGMGLSKGGLSSGGKQTSNIKNALKGALVGSKVGGIPGAIAGGVLGAQAQNLANGGGLLANVARNMFGVSPSYDSLEQSARAAALASNGGSFQPGSSNPSDYSYSPAAHDAIASGQGGLF